MEAMDSAASTFDATSADADSRILLRDVAWATYAALRDAPDHDHLRMTYLDGELEIMSPGRQHGVSAAVIGRLLEVFCFERRIPLYLLGTTTFREETEKRGLEADEAYARGSEKERPDLAIEVVVSSPLLDKLEVYRGLGVAEVWVFTRGTFTIHALAGGRYLEVETSVVFPELDLRRLAHFASHRDQNVALYEYVDELRRKS
jgi:Uma2 family endonuclease